MTATADPVETLRAIRPSPNFAGLLVGTALFGWLLWTERWDEPAAVFLFVLFGWVASVVFHEFAHAVVADLGGDHSVRERGYLDLDPTRYLDPLMSIALPVLFLLLGGLGLPGAAVWIDRGALRSRLWLSAVSIAGPFANAALAVIVLLPLQLDWVEVTERPRLAVALAFLGWLQVISVTINLLPVPGLDGYGAIGHWLPRDIQARAVRFGRYGFLYLVVLLVAVPSVGRSFFGFADDVAGVLGGDELLVDLGWDEFRFWDR